MIKIRQKKLTFYQLNKNRANAATIFLRILVEKIIEAWVVILWPAIVRLSYDFEVSWFFKCIQKTKDFIYVNNENVLENICMCPKARGELQRTLSDVEIKNVSR